MIKILTAMLIVASVLSQIGSRKLTVYPVVYSGGRYVSVPATVGVRHGEDARVQFTKKGRDPVAGIYSNHATFEGLQDGWWLITILDENLSCPTAMVKLDSRKPADAVWVRCVWVFNPSRNGRRAGL